MNKVFLCIMALLVVLSFSNSHAQRLKRSTSELTGKTYQYGYAPVNGLKMYYEVHGEGKPIILIHGAFSAIGTSFQSVLGQLSSARKVIAVEFQAHGRTGDIDRPVTYEQLADDLIALMSYAGVTKADFWGYSAGAAVAMQVYFKRPDLVDKMVLSSVSFSTQGIYQQVWDGISHITPEVFNGSIYKKEYDSIAPLPEAFPVLVKKMLALDAMPYDWKAKIATIKAPVLLIIGDADIVRPEHAVEMLRLLGGGVIGDMAGIPGARLAILPGTSHTAVMNDGKILMPMVSAFLNAPATN